jgi:ppGpp synthetase/RelA/SpoT-type nucleotidyltranferase
LNCGYRYWNYVICLGEGDLATGNEDIGSACIAAYHQALLILPDIQATIEKSRRFPPRFSWRFRAKTVESMEKKIGREQRTDQNYHVGLIRDRVGGRCVTLYRSEIKEVVTDLLALTKAEREGRATGPAYLYGAELDRITLHIAASARMIEAAAGPDSLTHALNQVLAQYGDENITLRTESKSDYSSVHLVFLIEHEKAPGGKYPVEFQVRTIFENTWSEVDHQLNYEANRGDGGAKDEDITETRSVLAEDLFFLRRLLDLAAEYADVIRVRRTPPPPPAEERFEKSLGDRAYVRKLCERQKLSADLTERLVKLVVHKEELDDEVELFSPEEREREYVQQAKSVRYFIEEFLVKASDCRAVLYLALMEEPIALLISENEKQIRAAYDLYRGITERFEKHPTCWFRRGNAAMKLGSISDEEIRIRLAAEAVEHFRETRKRLEAVVKLDKDAKFLLISDDQISKIRQQLPRAQGYAMWIASHLRRMENNDPDARDFKEMLEAYELARDGLPHTLKESQRGLRQNMLYYAIEARQLAETLAIADPALPATDVIAEITSEVEGEERRREEEKRKHGEDQRAKAGRETGGEAEKAPEPDIARWRVMHTLMKAYGFLGSEDKEIAQAADLASLLFHESKRPASKEVADLMAIAYQDAIAVLNRRKRPE